MHRISFAFSRAHESGRIRLILPWDQHTLLLALVEQGTQIGSDQGRGGIGHQALEYGSRWLSPKLSLAKLKQVFVAEFLELLLAACGLVLAALADVKAHRWRASSLICNRGAVCDDVPPLYDQFLKGFASFRPSCFRRHLANHITNATT